MTEDIPARYVAGELSEAEKDTFEKHYFECDRCFEAVRLCQAVQAELSRHAEPAPPARSAPRMPGFGWVAFAAAAAVLLVAGITWTVWRANPSQPPAASVPAAPASPAFEQLAQIAPPDYTKPVLRSAADPRFADAMRFYQQRDFNSAIGGLQAVASADPADQAARFYLGICYLLTDRTGEGIQALQEAVKLGGTAYLEAAHFYLAKARLRQNDAARAREELNTIVGLHGDMESQARSLLASIDAAAGH